MKTFLLIALCLAVTAALDVEEIRKKYGASYTPKEFLAGFNPTANQKMNTDVNAQWNYNVNTIPSLSNASAQADAALASWQQNQADLVNTLFAANVANASAPYHRQLKMIAHPGLKLSQSDTATLSGYVNSMIGSYSAVTLCPWVNGSVVNCTGSNSNNTWQLDPDIFNVLATSTNYDELLYVWNTWRQNNAGLKSTWIKFMNLSNKGAVAAGFNDTGDYWRSWYEQKNFTTTIQSLYYQILPLYETLHSYVRRGMKNQYKGRWSDSTIPAHILGNMWAQEWENIINVVPLYPKAGTMDVTKAMVAQGYNATFMFKTAEAFFVSLGLGKMVPSFWTKSVYIKPVRTPVNFVCHASAWDFYKPATPKSGRDFRIKMCTSVDMNNLITIHHEMGHIEYFMQYSIQPEVFRNGANPGFHEAIGDTIALSVATPKHLKKIGLLPANTTISAQQDLNFLYKQALEKVAFLPWGYLMDKWRWNVFNGQVNSSQWNNYWWQLRYQLQGLSAPNKRPANAFDPASKSHIDDNTPYIRYFVSFIVQFQFYQSMCKSAGQTGPLHTCDFYNSTAAGNSLMSMLSMGASQPWPQAMKKLTGGTTMSASAITTYFAPLTAELQRRNKAACDCYGWGNDAMYPKAVLKTLPTPRCSKNWSGKGCPAPTKKTPTKGASSLAPLSLLSFLSVSLILKKLF